MASRAWTGGSPIGEQRYRPVQPLWGMLAPGYNLNRDPFQLLANARFHPRRPETKRHTSGGNSRSLRRIAVAPEFLIIIANANTRGSFALAVEQSCVGLSRRSIAV